MELSRKANDAIKSLFTLSYTEASNCNIDLLYYTGGLGKYILFKYKDSKSEVPLLNSYNCIEHFMRGYDKVVYTPLIESNTPKFYRTPNMMFANMMSTNSTCIVSKVISTKGDIYYGAPGLILDKDKNPLLLCTVTINMNILTPEINKLTVYVNPKLFTNSGFLEKFITSKIIPYILSNGIVLKRGYTRTSLIDNIHYDRYGRPNKVIPNIIISEDIHNFFSTIDSNRIVTEEEINNTLVDNFDNLYEFLNA